jgi:DNA-binding MarR family transcriptional regulator
VRYNCWVNVSAEDSELVQLLTQLLRVVNPEGTGPGNPTAGNGHPRVSRPEAAAPDSGAPDSGRTDSGDTDSGSTGQPAAPGAAAGPDEANQPPLPVLSTSEARALIELVAARGIAQGQLGTLLGLEKSTVSRLAAGLERKGWIKRGRDETNQRYIRLYLTPEGSRVAAMVWRAWQSRQARILSGLSGREREGLAAGLRGLIRELAAERSAGDLPPG